MIRFFLGQDARCQRLHPLVATNFRLHLGGGLLLLAIALSLPAQSAAQIKYRPDHPEVKKIADAAASSLSVGSGDIGEATLTSLAYIQYLKRYENRVPKDNAAVNRTIDRILKMFPPDNAGSGDILNQGECYFPALALILLAEVDSVKYKDQITQLLEMFKDRQRPTGAFTYLGQPNTGDTSQTQFAALAMWVAKSKGFNIDIDMASNTLTWLCSVARGSGQWSYKYTAGGGSQQPSTLSMQAAGLSSVYLLADCLQLYQRKKTMTKAGVGEVGFPRTVTIYMPPVDGREQLRKDGPLTNFDRGLLNVTASQGNTSLENRFQYGISSWNYYYMYAVERYAYFREQAEGDVGGGAVKDWYDRGVEFLKEKQAANGRFTGSGLEDDPRVATSFALLFLVRSSELINRPPANSTVSGGNRLETDVRLQDTGDGQIMAEGAEQNLASLLKMLEGENKLSSEKMERITTSLKKQIIEFREKDDKSRGEIKGFLRSMVGAKNYFRRLIAVRFLAGEQDMDNVPALIYGLSDPDLRIAFEAHNGLRLISRKVDSMMLNKETIENAQRDPDILKKEPELLQRMKNDFSQMEKKWTDWFLKIRPDAELLGSQQQ